MISVRTCFCPKRNQRKLVCDCILSDDLIDDTDHKPSVVKLYYAIPVGRYGWKVEFLTMQSDSSSYTETDLFNYTRIIKNIINSQSL